MKFISYLIPLSIFILNINASKWYDFSGRFREYPRNLPLQYLKGYHDDYSVQRNLEMYLLLTKSYTELLSDPPTDILIRVNRVMKGLQRIFSFLDLKIAIVGIEIWDEENPIPNLEFKTIAKLQIYKRKNITTRVDYVHAMFGIENKEIEIDDNTYVMCTYSDSVGYTKVNLRLTSYDDEAKAIAASIIRKFLKNEKYIPENFRDWDPKVKSHMLLAMGEYLGSCLYDLPTPSLTMLYPEKIVTSQMLLDDFTYFSNRINRSNVRVYNPNDVEAFVKKVTLFMGPQELCGNGIIDQGEDCDCGKLDSSDRVTNSLKYKCGFCCDMTNCKLIAPAQCAGGPCCDIEIHTTYRGTEAKCAFKNQGSLCRKENNDCDLSEYCSGYSEWCPADVQKEDGTACVTHDKEKSYCAHGTCRHKNSWCKVLWGQNSRLAPAKCFALNEKSSNNSRLGDCGKKRPPLGMRDESLKNWEFNDCQNSDFKGECGRLWCTNLNNDAPLQTPYVEKDVVNVDDDKCYALLYDPSWPFNDVFMIEKAYRDSNLMYSKSYFSADMLYGGMTPQSIGSYQDLGMVPDGTPCSKGMCYEGKCRSINEVKNKKYSSCLSMGIYNSRGNCHCEPGYRPPYCFLIGPGGSLDSGLLSYETQAKLNISKFFLLMLLVLAIIAFLIFIIIRKRKQYLRKNRPQMVTRSTSAYEMDTSFSSRLRRFRRKHSEYSENESSFAIFKRLKKKFGDMSESQRKPKSFKKTKSMDMSEVSEENTFQITSFTGMKTKDEPKLSIEEIPENVNESPENVTENPTNVNENPEKTV